MDLRAYFQKIRELEAKIAEEFPIVVSLDTPDGGKAGTHTGVTRALAAKMIVEGVARLATEVEAAAFRALQEEASRVAQQIAAAAKVQVTVVAAGEPDKLKGAKQAK